MYHTTICIMVKIYKLVEIYTKSIKKQKPRISMANGNFQQNNGQLINL